MNRLHHRVIITLLLSTLTYSICLASPNQYGLNQAKIERFTGIKGRYDQQEEAFKVSTPRDDLKVTVNGAAITPEMGLMCWASFKKIGDDTIVIGDFALTEDQIYPVMDIAIKNNLNITALNNRYLWETPRVMFMHVEGLGKEEHLAKAVGKILAAIKSTSHSKGDLPYANLKASDSTLHSGQLDAILGARGKLKNGVYKITIANKEKQETDRIDYTMGANSWAAFIGSDQEGVMNGDLIINESELQTVLKSLHNAGIYVSGIHQRLPGQESQLLFLHYWGVGNTKKLARGLRNVLDYDNKMRLVARQNTVILAAHPAPHFQLSTQLNKLCCKKKFATLELINAIIKRDYHGFKHLLNSGLFISQRPS